MAKYGGRLVLLNRGSLTPQKRSAQPATPSSLLSRATGHPRQNGRMVSSCPSAPESLEQFEYHHLLVSLSSSHFYGICSQRLESGTDTCLRVWGSVPRPRNRRGLCYDFALRSLSAVGCAMKGKWEMWLRVTALRSPLHSHGLELESCRSHLQGLPTTRCLVMLLRPRAPWFL